MKNDFQLFYHFHVRAHLFISAWPILGYFLVHFFMIFRQNCHKSLKVVISCHFEYFYSFLVQSLSGGGVTFNFWPFFKSTH